MIISRTLDWLLVTADGRIAVKGSADLSGTPVGFVFYGAQGCGSGLGSGCQPGPDRIRMLIWRLSDGPTPEGVNPIYDNVPGGSFELDDFLDNHSAEATCRSTPREADPWARSRAGAVERSPGRRPPPPVARVVMALAAC